MLDLECEAEKLTMFKKSLILNVRFSTFFLFVAFTFCIFIPKTSNAQSYIGLTSGYIIGKYFETWKQKNIYFDSKYRIKEGYQVTLFYQQVNPKNKGRFEIQYGSQQTEFEVKKNPGNNATYTHLTYRFQYFQLNFDYAFNLLTKNNKTLEVFVGPSGSLIFNSLATGNGYDPISVLAFTPSGQPYYTTSFKEWEISNEKRGGLSIVNFGINFGLDFHFPIYKNVDCFIQNRNTLFLNRQIFLNDNNPTAFIKSGINIGLRFKISSKNYQIFKNQNF